MSPVRTVDFICWGAPLGQNHIPLNFGYNVFVCWGLVWLGFCPYVRGDYGNGLVG